MKVKKPLRYRQQLQINNNVNKIFQHMINMCIYIYLNNGLENTVYGIQARELVKRLHKTKKRHINSKIKCL